MNAEELAAEPVDQFFTNLYINAQIEQKQQREIAFNQRHG